MVAKQIPTFLGEPRALDLRKAEGVKIALPHPRPVLEAWSSHNFEDLHQLAPARVAHEQELASSGKLVEDAAHWPDVDACPIDLGPKDDLG